MGGEKRESTTSQRQHQMAMIYINEQVVGRLV